jgi:hypothetical protein
VRRLTAVWRSLSRASGAIRGAGALQQAQQLLLIGMGEVRE